MKPTILDAPGLSAKPPWRWRFAPTVNLKEIAATAGIGALYGLLFANLLFAPLLPHLAAQSNSPINNAPTNSVHRDVYYNNPEFRDANSREDCDRILKELLEKIKNKSRKITKDWEAAEECDKTYERELKTADLQHKLDMARAANTASEIFSDCLGIGGLAGGTAAGATYGWKATFRGATVAISRVGSGVIGLVVSIGAFAVCEDLRDDTAQDAVDAANKIKKNADELALLKRDRCRETTNYERAKRKFQRWHRRGGKTSRGQGGHWWAKRRANADHAKCLALFPSGDCGTTD